MSDAAWKIALSDLDYGREEEEAVLAVLRSKWLTMGAVTKKFEEEFAAAIGVKHAIAVTNGTDALMLSYLALGIAPGDEIIQPAVNFVASANMTLHIGARPVFADICSLEDPTIDPAEIEKAITSKTRAVVVMHYGGASCRMPEIQEICSKYNLALIEDACHGVGGSGYGRKMGAWGDAAAFSFFSNKNLAVGEGGMITTDRDDLAEILRGLRSHGMTTLTWDRHRGHASTYDVTLNGLNARIDEIRSALGREQLKKLQRNNEKRRALAREYHRLIDSTSLASQGWIFPELGASGNDSSHHLMVAVAPDAETRTAAMARLKSAGIQTSIHYPFIPDFTAFREMVSREARENLAKSEAFCARELTLPLHPLLDSGDTSTVITALAKV
ncbi:DegT/DnrJ/EryC1/StrS family aminotransferase [bacterium]|nr:DegT/DnrJ/EryC1/StrS family aminotransferase [bacterium]